jgi:hypothetical protein
VRATSVRKPSRRARRTTLDRPLRRAAQTVHYRLLYVTAHAGPTGQRLHLDSTVPLGAMSAATEACPQPPADCRMFAGLPITRRTSHDHHRVGSDHDPGA